MVRRQAFRREPIEIDLGDDEIIVIEPIPWLRRNEFANTLLNQHAQAVNESVKMWVEEGGVPQLEIKMAEKFSDPFELFNQGLPSPVAMHLKEIGEQLHFSQIIAILLAICEVNELQHLTNLIDPNSPSPTLIGGALSSLLSAGVEDGAKIESIPDSSSPESIEVSSMI